MARLFRYALATVCFVASVGCLALWWRSDLANTIVAPWPALTTRAFICETIAGSGEFYVTSNGPRPFCWSFTSVPIAPNDVRAVGSRLSKVPQFGRIHRGVHFPLWYPALILALAGIAFLRLGRRFTLRSAIIATTVVAALLGMAVIL